MTAQADVTAARIRRIAIVTAEVDRADPPVDGSSEPDVTLSPVTPTGLRTTGFLLILKAPVNSAPAVPSGVDDTFLITVWVHNPVSNVWGAGEPTAIGYNQAFVTGDLDAAEIYFQIEDVGGEGGGSIDFHVAEQ